MPRHRRPLAPAVRLVVEGAPLAPGRHRGVTRRRGLGQDMPSLFDTSAAEGAQDISDADAATFSSWWQQYTSIWPAFLETRQEIADHKARWLQIAQDAYGRSDMATWKSATDHAIDLNSLEQQRAAVEARAVKYRDAWDGIKQYLSSLGRWSGMGYFHGLGLPPLVLAVGLASAIAAIAYVVTTYYQIRRQLDFDQGLLGDVEAGKITAQDAAALKKAGAGAAGIGGALGDLGKLLDVLLRRDAFPHSLGPASGPGDAGHVVRREARSRLPASTSGRGARRADGEARDAAILRESAIQEL